MLLSKIDKIQDGRIFTIDEHKRAPKGGISLKGKEFKGGQFIPSEYHAEFKKETKKKQEGSNKKNVKSITNGFKVIQEGLSSEQLAREISEIKDWKRSRKNFGESILSDLGADIKSKDSTGFIYKDNNGKTKGIALATDNIYPKKSKFFNYVELSYLVTKEKGYGTKMIARVVRNALKENKNGIILESLASAKKFYEKIGMQRVEEYSDVYMFDKKGMKEFINKFDKKE